MMKRIILYTVVAALFSASLVLNGCKKKDDAVVTPPVVDNSVPKNVFPLTAGHALMYNGYLTSGDTETKIAGTDAGYSSTWVITGNTPLAAVLGPLAQFIPRTSASLILDTTKAVGKVVFTPIFAYYDTTSGDYYYLTNLGYNYRKYQVSLASDSGKKIRIDSLKFIKLASPSAGIGTEFSAYHDTLLAYLAGPGTTPTKLVVDIKGKFDSKQNVTVNVNGKDSTFSAYYLIITNVAGPAGGTQTGGITARLWLVPGVGPVQMFIAGNVEQPGNYRTLKGMNF
ncbi:MAG: hypothetical protein PHP42_04120 [Bacteroidota bacterium]|nr:hypothetical protein [Bacteroidota bacterium]